MPEEINRLYTDAIADLLFTTDQMASENLRREVAPEENIQLVGNTMIDSLLRHVEAARSKPLPGGLTSGQFGVLTLHRPSNVDSRETLAGILHAVSDVSRRLPIAFPVHPRTLQNLDKFGLGRLMQDHPAIRIMQPLSYLPFLGLVAHSSLVLTDSGGVEEETTVLGIPCLTMRANTERPITCEVGANVLVGCDTARIRSAAFAALEEKPRRYSVPEMWDGQAGERIVTVLLNQSSTS